MDDPAEPVRVFIRIRPEGADDDVGMSPMSSPLAIQRKNSVSTLSTESSPRQRCVSVVDSHTVRLSPPDGALGSRRSVSAVDDKVYSFDAVFPEYATQEDVYSHVSSLVRATIKGYNTTIFAYGCTGSGKSYTMTGKPDNPGIIPRAISEIFSIIESTAHQEQDVYFYVRMSYVELYNNNFRNLLDFVQPSENSLNTSRSFDESGFADLSTLSNEQSRPNSKDKIEVRESASTGVFLAGPNLRIPVISAKEAFSLIAKGNKARATGFTQCNDLSSRSHAVLTIHVESRLSPNATARTAAADGSPIASPRTEAKTANDATLPSELRLGKMHLVDLAGSERLAMSQAEGETLVETQNINLSLTALGDVLSALSRNAQIMQQQSSKIIVGGSERSISPSRKGSKAPASLSPVPYRNSKLTHLLKDSLGGNSKTIMITNIRTLSEYYQQTAISLMYAYRAKKVRNRSVLNRNIVGDTGIHAVTEEIEKLRSRLEQRSAEYERLKLLQMQDAEENLALKSRFLAMQAANDQEKKQLEAHMKHVIHSQAGQLVSQKQKITLLQQSLQGELVMSQNKIAEQEKEIKWLKRALDESTEAAQTQPTDQLERMQRVADGWQAQAKSAQKELATCTVALEANQLKVAELTRENEELKFSLQAVVEESKSKTSEIKNVSAALSKSLTESDILSKINKELKDQAERLKDQVERYKLQLSKDVDLGSKLAALQSEVERRSVENEGLRTQNEKLEKDRRELRTKLDTTIGELEKKSGLAIENATHRVAEKDEHIRMMTDRLKAAEKLNLQLQSQVQDMETRLQLSEIANSKKVDGVQDQLRARVAEIQDLRSGFNVQLQEIQMKYESQLQEERASRALSEGRIREEATKYLKEQINMLQINHNDELASMKAIAEERIRHSEEAMKRQIDDEIDGGIKSLKLKHAVEISEIQETARLRLEEQVNKERTKAEKNLKEALKQEREAAARSVVEIESKFSNEISRIRLEHAIAKEKLQAQHSEEMRETLRKEREQLSVDKNSELHALIVQQRESSEDLQRAFNQEKESIVAKLTRDFDRKMKEQEEQLAAQFEDECSRRVDEAVRETKAKYQSQLKSAVAAHKSKLEDKLKDKFSEVASEEENLKKKEMELELYWREHSEREIQSQIAALKEENRLELDEALRKVKQERDEHWMRIADKERRDLTFQHKVDMQALEDELQKKQTEALAKLESKLFELHSQNIKREIEQMEIFSSESEANHKEELEFLQQKHSLELAVAVKETREVSKKELKEAMDALSKECEERQSRALNEQQVKMQTDFETRMQKLEKNHSQQCEEIKLQSKRELENTLSRALQELKDRHRRELQELQQQNRDELQAALNAQKTKLEERYKSLLSEKDAIIAQIRADMSSMIQSSSEDLSKSLLEQQTTLIDRHRQETQRLRQEIADLEMKHEELLTTSNEQREADLVAQRKQLDQAHETELDQCRQEISALEDKYNSYVKESSLARQREELMASKAQLDQFNDLLRTSLQERDDFHRAQTQRAVEAFENDKAKLHAAHERMVASMNSEKEIEIENLKNAFQSAEAKWKAQSSHEVEAREARHREEIARITSDLNSKHSMMIAEVRAAERTASEAKIQSIMADIDKTKELYNDSAFALARQRADFEREKLELSTSHQEEISLLESSFDQRIASAEAASNVQLSTALAHAKDQYEAKLASIENAHQHEIKKLLLQKELELNEMWEQKLNDAESMHCKQVQELDRAVSKLTDETRQLVQSFERETSKAQAAHQQQLVLLETELNNRHQHEQMDLTRKLEAKHASLVAEMKELERATYENKLSGHKREREALMQSHAFELAKLKDSHEREKQDLLLQQQRLIEIEKNKHISESFEAETKRSSERQTAIASLNLDHIAQLESLRIAHQRELFERLNEKDQEFAAKLTKSISKMKSENEQLIADMAERHKLAIQTLICDHAIAVEELEAQVKQLKQQKEDLLELHKSKLDDLSLRMKQGKDISAEREQQLAREIISLKESHENELASKDQNLRLQINSLAESHQNELNELRLKSDQLISSLTDKFAADTQQQQSEHSVELEALRQSCDQKALSLNQQLAQLLEEKVSYENLLQSLRAQLSCTQSETVSKFVQMTEELKSVNEKLNCSLQEQQNLKEALDTTQTSKDTLLGEFAKEKLAYENKLGSLQQSFDEESTKWNEDLDALARELVLKENDFEQLTAERDQLRERLKQLVVESESQLKEQADIALRRSEGAIREAQEECKQQIRLISDQCDSKVKELEELNVKAIDRNNLLGKELVSRSELVEELREEVLGNQILQEEFSNQIDQLNATIIANQQRFNAIIQEKDATILSLQSTLTAAHFRISELENQIELMKVEFADELNSKLQQKEEEINKSYMSTMAKQIDSLQEAVESQSRSQQRSWPQLAELHKKFLDVAEDIPTFIRDAIATSKPTADEEPNEIRERSQSVGTNTARIKIPISVLKQAEEEVDAQRAKQLGNSFSPTFAAPKAPLVRSASLSKLGQSSMSSVEASSPTDQLITSIAEWDVQGLRTMVRGASGEDLKSEYWKPICKKVQPLHRAIAALHNHGNEKQLMHVLEALLQLGVNIHITDSDGNTCLHKAVIVCTSKYVVPIINMLLHKGADARARNKDGDMAIHLECKRLRPVSVDVIGVLLGAITDPNVVTRSVTSKSLQEESMKRTKMSNSIDLEDASECLSASTNGRSGNTEYSLLQLVLLSAERCKKGPERPDDLARLKSQTNWDDDGDDANDWGDRDANLDEVALGMSSCWHAWVGVADSLVKQGCKWSINWREPVNKNSELHLLLSAYPPPPDCKKDYRSLVNSCLATGQNISLENNVGDSVLFVFCRRLSMLMYANHTKCIKMFSFLLQSNSSISDEAIVRALESTNWDGKSIFSIEHSAESCLAKFLEIAEKKLQAYRLLNRMSRASSRAESNDSRRISSARSLPIDRSSRYDASLSTNSAAASGVIDEERGPWNKSHQFSIARPLSAKDLSFDTESSDDDY